MPKIRSEPKLVDTDGHLRPGMTRDELAALRPTFHTGGSVTTDTSRGINDGAAAVLVTTAQRAAELGLQSVVRIVSTVVAGVAPGYMGLGPIPATRKALKQAGLRIDQIHLVELNEAVSPA